MDEKHSYFEQLFFFFKSADSIATTENQLDKMGDSNRQNGLSANKLMPI